MNKRIPRILVCASLLLLSSCGGGRILYLFEQPYWSTLGGDVLLQTRLYAHALSRAMFPSFDLTRAGSDPRAELTRALATGRYGTVVIGPLLSLDSLQIARDYPRINFVLIHAAPSSVDVSKNITVLVFDRREALRTAGKVAALVTEKRSPNASDSSLSIGVLTNAAADFSTEEIDAFRDGATSDSHVKDVVTQSVGLPADTGAVQAALAAMRKNGAQVFLLALGAANPAALDALKTTGGVAVVADWRRARLDPAQVLLSVETEEADGIMRAVAAKHASVVAGKVHLVLGDAPPLPAEARALFEAQR